MKIVVLDGYTLAAGDLSWEGLRRLGEVTVYDRTPRELIVERSYGAEILLTNKTPLDRETLAQLPHLKYIGVTATGFNVVDVAAARERGVVVTNVPAYSTRSVAQFVFALLLELCHHVGLHNEAVHQGEWVRSVDFMFTKTPLIELAGKTMGIVGYGQIGRQVAQLAQAFGMDVLVMESLTGSPRGDSSLPRVSKEELFSRSDVVTLHTPLTPASEGLINRETLSLMKPSAFLINTARGGLVKEQDLADSLNQGQIAGAGLDVLSVEPPTADNPLLTAKNCIITPHIAWATREARGRLMEMVVKNVEAFLRGTPINTVQ